MFTKRLFQFCISMTDQTLDFTALRQAEALTPLLAMLKQRIESHLNLKEWRTDLQPITVTTNLIQRLCFAAGLSIDEPRSEQAFKTLPLSDALTIHDTVFTRNNYAPLWSALVKLRYKSCLPQGAAIPHETMSKIVGSEMLRGAELCLHEEQLQKWLHYVVSDERSGAAQHIPALNLHIGAFSDTQAQTPAYLNLNGRDIANTQILIAGATGSGKTNLLAVLLQQIRGASVETPFPVHVLVFDYKGEFSDPANSAWLRHFEFDSRAVHNLLLQPLPFNPFKDFRPKAAQPQAMQSEINLYATELANALLVLDRSSLSANMANRLTEAVINAYKASLGAPITFERVLDEYILLQDDKSREKTDSVKSTLSQLIRANLFAPNDSIDLIRTNLIVKLDTFPKEGILAKAVVYFTIAKLNAMYESLPQQAVNATHVELRHFTIIDEAHYMLDFDNKPLRNLIAVGRNKGLSIILATQAMESFRSEYFDFYANAQYPLIMRQQSMNDRVLRDLFGISGQEFQRLKEAITNLKKGEVILRSNASNASSQLLSGRKFRTISVTHLI
jgi:energy-coupling factor transporter ATP-binding protein EcfA2